MHINYLCLGEMRRNSIIRQNSRRKSSERRRSTSRKLSHERSNEPTDENELVAEYERNMDRFCFTFQICLIIYAFIVIAVFALQYYLERMDIKNEEMEYLMDILDIYGIFNI